MTQQEANGQDPDEEPNAQTIMPGRSPDRDSMASDYLPEEHDWLAKTVLDRTDPQKIAGLSNFDQLFDDPEIQATQESIKGVLHMFMRGRTSVSGASREEYASIIKAQYGQGGEDDAASNLGKLLADTVDED